MEHTQTQAKQIAADVQNVQPACCGDDPFKAQDSPCAPAEPVAPESPFYPESAVLEQQLLNAGVTPAILSAEWGLALWSIRPKNGYVRIKVDPKHFSTAPLRLNELEHWFQTILHQPVSVIQCPVSECCHKPCKGCLCGNPQKRAFWLPYLGS